MRVNNDGTIWTNDDAKPGHVAEGLRLVLADYVAFAHRIAAAMSQSQGNDQ